MGTDKVKQDNSAAGGLILIAAALAFVLYQQNSPSVVAIGSSDPDHARAYVAGDMAFSGAMTAPGPSPTPEPAPGPRQCPVCNGTGKVGDGRIFVDCGTCGGTGVITKKVSFEEVRPQLESLSTEALKGVLERMKQYVATPKAEKDSTVGRSPIVEKVVGQRQVILYRDPDSPLQNTDQAIEALKAAGWSFGEDGAINVLPDTAEYKHGTWVLVEGGRVLKTQWIDMDAKQIADFYEHGTEFKAAEKYELSFSHRGSYWSHPGDIRQHLLSGNHGFTAEELEGLSNDQLEALHSHEHENGRQRLRWNRMVVQPMRTFRYCPNGNCPQ